MREIKNTKNRYSEKWVEQAWESYSPQIYNLCKMKCANREDARDVFQNVALRFCQNAQEIVYDKSIFPWLFRVFRNCFYDYVRSRQRESPFSKVSDVMGNYAALPEESSVFFKAGNKKNDELDRAVESLSPNDRFLIDMTFEKGLSIKEISMLCGLPLNTAAKRRYSAIKKARKALLG